MAEEKSVVVKIVAELLSDRVLANTSQESQELYDKSRYGEPMRDKFQYSLVESLFLLEKGRMTIMKGKKELDFDALLKHCRKIAQDFWIRYIAFKDMRDRGYIVKTALKFGADFRVYDRGVKPGEDHAKWVMFPIAESGSCSWHEFAAKNRVAHSTRKRLLIAIVDEEGDVTYYSIAWTRP
jgi:tRNA-intron endonuclease, archaea type